MFQKLIWLVKFERNSNYITIFKFIEFKENFLKTKNLFDQTFYTFQIIWKTAFSRPGRGVECSHLTQIFEPLIGQRRLVRRSYLSNTGQTRKRGLEILFLDIQTLYYKECLRRNKIRFAYNMQLIGPFGINEIISLKIVK